MQIIYLGNNQAKELPTMILPLMKDFHDPMHYDMELDVFVEHIEALRTFDVADELAATLTPGETYDETFFKLKTIITTIK